MQTGDDITIMIGGAVGPSCVVSRCLHGVIGASTAKAVELLPTHGAKESIWLPKSALVAKTSEFSGDTYYRLASWFRPDARQWAFIERHESISGQSAAY